jgi:hypothetical protein
MAYLSILNFCEFLLAEHWPLFIIIKFYLKNLI